MTEESAVAPEATPKTADEIDMSDLAAKVAAATEEAAESQDLTGINDPSIYDTDVEVPASKFWDKVEGQAPEESEGEEPQEVAETEADTLPGSEPQTDVSDSQTIKFKANGQEQEISLEEARKKLAMAEGGAKAFSDLAKAKKKLRELDSRLPDLQKKAELLDKLESVSHDPEAIIKIATGKDPQEFLAEYLRKQRIIETGTDAERAQLEREERLAKLERELEVERAEREQIRLQEESRSLESTKSTVKNMLDSEFHKVSFNLEDANVSNGLNELLWETGNKRMKEYVKKYQDHPKFQELLPKMVKQSFEEAHKKLDILTASQVQTKVDEAIKTKKQKAAEKAAVASTRRLAEVDPKSFQGMSISQVARKLGLDY